MMAPRQKQKAPCYVLGVGMTKFLKPRGKVDYTELGFEAGVKAMLDAQINYDDVDQGIACYCYGDSTCGQRVFYQFGMTQIPIINVNNNCSTGSTGLAIGRQYVSSGAADCVLVVGFEKMMPGSLATFFNDRENPTGTSGLMMASTRGFTNAPGAAQMFGNAGREYMEKYIFPRHLVDVCRTGLTCCLQIWCQGRGLCRDRPREPRAQRQQPILAVPRRLHTRADPKGAHDL